MFKGFREFVLRGNVIDLAVAFVVGAAFSTLVGAFSEALINPVVGIFLGGGIDVGQITVRDQVIDITIMLNALITFIITLTVIYFIFVVPMNSYRRKTGQGAVDATPADVKLLTEIRDLLKQNHAP
ncbi:large-conductance mechanosensitive channel [Actinomycetes bacterium]|nr:large-conductance mechanosensitive channel [Actinomycetes bacterium]